MATQVDGKSIERVIELFYAAIRLIFLVIDAPSRRAPSGAQRKLRVTAEKLARPAINHARISPDCAARGSYFFVDTGEGGMMMMMKHGHAKRVINSCPSRVSPFYRVRYRHHLEGNSPGLVRAMRATRGFNKRLFFNDRGFIDSGRFVKEGEREARVESIGNNVSIAPIRSARSLLFSRVFRKIGNR